MTRRQRLVGVSVGAMLDERLHEKPSRGGQKVRCQTRPALDLAHSALADEPNHFVRAESRAGREAHLLGVLRGKRPTGAFS